MQRVTYGQIKLSDYTSQGNYVMPFAHQYSIISVKRTSLNLVVLLRLYLVQRPSKDAEQSNSRCHSAADIVRPDSLADIPQGRCHLGRPSFQS
jgi:hypothetical protein